MRCAQMCAVYCTYSAEGYDLSGLLRNAAALLSPMWAQPIQLLRMYPAPDAGRAAGRRDDAG